MLNGHKYGYGYMLNGHGYTVTSYKVQGIW